MNPKTKGIFAVLTVYTIFGLNIVFAKDLTRSDLIGPSAIVLCRLLGGGVLFWIAGLFGKREKVEKGDLLRLFFASMLGLFIPLMSTVWGVTMSTPFDASLVATLKPLMTVLVAWLLLGTRASGREMLGVLLSLCGAVLLVLAGKGLAGQVGAGVAGQVGAGLAGQGLAGVAGQVGAGLAGQVGAGLAGQGVAGVAGQVGAGLAGQGLVKSGAGTSPLGLAVLLMNGLSFATYLVLFKPLVSKYSPVTFMKWMFLFSLVVAVPVAAGDVAATSWANLPLTMWAELGFMVLFASFIAFFLSPIGQKNLSPTQYSLFSYTQLLVAGVLGLLLGMDSFSPIKLLAALLILVGVRLCFRQSQRRSS